MECLRRKELRANLVLHEYRVYNVQAFLLCLALDRQGVICDTLHMLACIDGEIVMMVVEDVLARRVSILD